MADIILNITIKDEYKQRILDALNGAVDRNIAVAVYGEDVGDTINFSYLPQGANTPKVFAEKVLKKLFLSFVRAYEYAQDTIRYNNDKNNVALPTQTVPDDIVE